MARVVTFFFILTATVNGSVPMQKLIESEDIHTNISHMVVSQYGDIYVGTMNKIYHLNSSLGHISSVVLETVTGRENVVNVLVLVENFTTNMSLMTCASFSGCQMRHLTNISIYRNITGSKVSDDTQGTKRPPDPILLSNYGCIRMGSTYDLFDIRLTRGFTEAKLSEETFSLVDCDKSKSIPFFNVADLANTVESFVYGFSFEKLDYYFMNQKSYGPTVAKLCYNKQYAYSEMPIRCFPHDYTILKSMQYTRINQTDGLIVGVFTNNNESGSAVCSFKYSYIQTVMVDNIKECFSGANYSKEYLKTNRSCQQNQDQRSDDEYLCTYIKHNQIVIGNKTAVGEVIPYDGNKSLAAVGVVHISRRTLVLLGTLTGQVDEIIQNANGSWSRLKSFDLNTSSIIGRDILFDSGRRHFYVFSKSKIFKYQLHNCDEYKYCHTCLAPGNQVFCGWCLLQNKCGILEDCKSTIWLQGPAYGVCHVVRNISPPTFNIHSTQVNMLDFYSVTLAILVRNTF